MSSTTRRAAHQPHESVVEHPPATTEDLVASPSILAPQPQHSVRSPSYKPNTIGGHCALPLHASMGLIGTSRISMGVYTTREDIEAALVALRACWALEGIGENELSCFKASNTKASSGTMPKAKRPGGALLHAELSSDASPSEPVTRIEG